MEFDFSAYIVLNNIWGGKIVKRRNKLRYAACLLLSVIMVFGSIGFTAYAEENQYPSLALNCKSAVLMEASTGEILYASNENEALPPASVTKVMTLLLVMEAIEEKKISYTDMVSASEHACSMGGSQIYLEAGEQMSVEELLKSVVIASANDAAVTLAEYVAGTEEAFVELMNKKAAELGMENTFFENANGLDDTTEKHLTSAKDIAIMSRELIKYPKITEYSSIWIDTVRNGEFGLTNTNRLVRFYKGCTGLKTGSTSKAGFCISATAERDGLSLIAVIMGSPSRDERNAAAVSLLNYGFSNFTVFSNTPQKAITIPVVKGKTDTCQAVENEFKTVINKKYLSKIERTEEYENSIIAPVKKGQNVGTVTYSIDGKVIGQVNIVTAEAVETLKFFDIFIRMIAKFSYC